MGIQLITVKFPPETYKELKAARDDYNKGRRGSKLSLANYLALIFNQNKAATLSQPTGIEQEKPVIPETITESVIEPIEEHPADQLEGKEVTLMSDTCPHCTAREIEMQRLNNEVVPGIKKESELKERELTEKINSLTKQISEYANKDIIPDDLNAVISHCEDGSCKTHAKQWTDIQRKIIDANKPAIIQAALENIPDSVVEAEGLKRGFIPKKITIPMRRL